MSKHYPVRRYPGFTIVELLVVISIIGVLLALLFPAVQAAREAARRAQCSNSLRQLGVALQGYHGIHERFPSGVVVSGDDFRRGDHAGLVLLLPLLEEQALHDVYDFTKPWDDDANRVVRQTRLTLLLCPSSGNEVPQDGGVAGAPTDFAFSKGPLAYLSAQGEGGGMFDVNSRVRMADIRDGASHTYAMGEAASSSNLPAAAA